MCLFRRIRRIRRFVNSLLLTIPLLFIFFKLIKWFNKRSEAKKQQEIEDRMANLEKKNRKTRKSALKDADFFDNKKRFP